jgi:transcriptional accessory protein Tex/SPT6
MMKAEILPLDLELKSFSQTRTERIFLTKNQYQVLDVVAQALDQTIAEYITDTLLSMMECDIEETVTRKMKERFSREPVEVFQR